MNLYFVFVLFYSIIFYLSYTIIFYLFFYNYFNYSYLAIYPICRGRRRKSKKSTDGDTSEVEGVIEAALSMEEPELDSEGLGLIPDTDGPTDGDTDLILGSDSVILDSELDDLSIVLGTDDDDSDLDTFIGIV